MSIIIASGEQISKSPLNKSTAKQMFSFPKAERFEKLKPSSISNSFYNLPPVTMTRSTSFGKGEKYDFTSHSKGKNAQFYNVSSEFDVKKPKTPAWSFGISRAYYDKVYCETNKMFDKNVPGPGKYNYLKPFGSETSKFSFYGRGEEKNLEKKVKGPGPGEYTLVNINPSGKYPLSKMKNTTAIVFGLNKEKRFNYELNKNPGPNKYDQKPLINGTGFNYVSKYKSSTAKTITGKRKDFSSKHETPGPGSYRAFSEWGIYESKNASLNNSSGSPDRK